MKRLFIAVLIVVFSLSSQIGTTGAYLSDTETVSGITITAGTWDVPPPASTAVGTVVINEVYWMGSGGDDEWVELKNTTGSAINLTGWKINLGSGGADLSLFGIIPANGFFLISEKATNDSDINNSITSDQVYASLTLPDSGRQLVLKDLTNTIIDSTPTGSWPAGSHTGGNRKSMERNSTPGDGTLAGSWHTCIDSHCNDTTYWDTEGNNYGTPKAANLSENDPTEVNLSFYKTDATHVGFRLSGQGLTGYDKASYTITYDSDQTKQGIVGSVDIDGKTDLTVTGQYLGFCSTGGTCVSYSGVKNINIEVKLTGASEKVLSSSIN